MAMLIGQCVAFSAIHLLVHLFVTVTKTPQVRNIKNIPIKIINLLFYAIIASKFRPILKKDYHCLNCDNLSKHNPHLRVFRDCVTGQ